MLRLLIVDDELPARSRMRRLAGGISGCEVIGEAGTADAALTLINELTPDVLLLDISMPGMDGMTLARQLADQESAPAVVFCTAHSEHALKAFDSAAVDYLVKPVSVERLENALDRAARFLGKERQSSFLAATLGGSTQLVELDAVVGFLAEDKYTTAFLDGRTLMINHSLMEIEQMHPDRFLRIHRNALVSRERLRGLERSEDGMRLNLGHEKFKPLVSRRQLPLVRKVLKEMQ
jgi:two-component system response regulator AlgR